MDSKMSVRSIRMEDTVFLKMKAIAKQEGRSATKQIETALKQFIAEYEEQHGSVNI